MQKNLERAAALISIVLLLLCFIPVMYLGRYNHPTGDDYFYGAETHLVWEETGSLARTISAAAQGVAEQYQLWQGTYSALFLMYLPPNLFGDEYYSMITAVILLLLAGSIFYFWKPVLCDGLRTSKQVWIGSSAVLSMLCLEAVPSQGESFFWYNGSMYYTGFWAGTLFFWGILLRYVKEQKKYRLVLLALLAVFLAGGNYVSLLPCLLLSGTLSVGFSYLRFHAEKGRKQLESCKSINQKTVVSLWGITFLMLAGLAVSAAAPGNRVRQDGMWKIPAWKAVLKSLLQGVNYVREWTSLWWLLAAVCMTPFLWQYFKKTPFRFPCPLVVIGYFYGVFCSMACPLFYTMNSTGPARAVAICFYSYQIFSFLSYGYFLGWFCRKWKERGEQGLLQKWENRTGNFAGKHTAAAVWAVFLAVLIVLLLGTGQAENATTTLAVKLLASGEAAAYDREYQQRLQILESQDTGEVVLQPFLHQPAMLYVGDFPGDSADETNRKAAQYFKKESVRVEY